MWWDAKMMEKLMETFGDAGARSERNRGSVEIS